MSNKIRHRHFLFKGGIMNKKQLQSISERRIARNKRKKRNRIIRRSILGASCVVLFIVMVFCLTKRDDLKGVWNFDNVTLYRFDGNGKGAMVLPTSEYSFLYEINDNKVFIDFEDENAQDYTYSFRIEKKKLFLSGGEGEDAFCYELEKK